MPVEEECDYECESDNKGSGVPVEKNIGNKRESARESASE